MATEAGDAGAVGAELEHRRFSRPEIEPVEGNGAPLLSEAVAGQVHQLLDASEAAARAIRDRAVAEAESMRAALVHEAEQTRREVATRAQQQIAAVVGDSLRRLTEKAAMIDASLDELRAEANMLASNLSELGAGPTPAELPASQPAVSDGERRGRMIALTMAVNGAPREETARYLQENLEMHDIEALLDTVYR
jgi:hypothetical protein